MEKEASRKTKAEREAECDPRRWAEERLLTHQECEVLLGRGRDYVRKLVDEGEVVEIDGRIPRWALMEWQRRRAEEAAVQGRRPQPLGIAKGIRT